MSLRRNLYLFGKKRSGIKRKLREDFIDNGIATLPCKVKHYDDIISRYSIEKYETLNPEFAEYIEDMVEAIPPEYPIVLNITGHIFTEKEQSIIRESIIDYFDYDLGVVEKRNNHHLRVFIFFLIGIIISGVILWQLSDLEEVPREFLFVVFWFFADTLVSYIFLDGYDLKREKILSARLSCIQVEFSEHYDERDYTAKEAAAILDKVHRSADHSK